jgi:hypothetical protein
VEDGDAAAVVAAVRGYFDAWFDGDPERMRAVLHPRLAKRRLAVASDREAVDGLYEVTAAEMVDDAASGPKTSFDREYDVDVLDLEGDIATVRVRSNPFIEYVHVGRVDGRWLILNTLYVRRGPR